MVLSGWVAWLVSSLAVAGSAVSVEVGPVSLPDLERVARGLVHAEGGEVVVERWTDPGDGGLRAVCVESAGELDPELLLLLLREVGAAPGVVARERSCGGSVHRLAVRGGVGARSLGRLGAALGERTAVARDASGRGVCVASPDPLQEADVIALAVEAGLRVDGGGAGGCGPLIRSAQVGPQPAPEGAIRISDGGPVLLGAHLPPVGVAVFAFGGSWCARCAEEAAALGPEARWAWLPAGAPADAPMLDLVPDRALPWYLVLTADGRVVYQGREVGHAQVAARAVALAGQVAAKGPTPPAEPARHKARGPR